MGLNSNEMLEIFPKNYNYVKNINTALDTSNILHHKGQTLDISLIPSKERINLLNELSFDQIQKYNNLECVRAENHFSTPTRKMHYPEPFIASASFIHTDIGFVHILHYQYWLWFVFIFLIVFFSFHFYVQLGDVACEYVQDGKREVSVVQNVVI
jgi:hypothetical protein